jgi:adenylate cyclase
MPVEIEHKFLVHTKHLPKKLPAGEHLQQGYLSVDPAVRIRIITPAGKGKKPRAVITIKGKGLRERAEFEYAIPLADAKILLALCGEKTIEKTRYKIKGWELDEFHGRHQGLWLAEYELKSAKAQLPALPPWIAKEVTEDRRFTNSQLSLKPWRASNTK